MGGGMHSSLDIILPALADLWFWEPPGWESCIEDDKFVVYDGDGAVVAGAPLTDTKAVRRLKAMMATVNLVNDNLERLRFPYDADSQFSTMLERLREAENEAAELREENARLHARLRDNDCDVPF